MKKRIISLFMVFAMLAALMPGAFAASEMTLGIAVNKTQLIPGEEVVFTVSVAGAVDIVKMQYTFEYDNERLEYKNKAFKELLDTATLKNVKAIPDEGKLGFTATLAEPFTGDGEICSFTFKVKDDASSGEVSYGVSNTKFGAEGSSASESVVVDENNKELINVVGSESDNKIKVTSDKAEAREGEEVKFTVEFPETLLRGIEFDFNYPQELLEFEKYEYNQDISDNALISQAADHDDYTRVIVAYSENTLVGGNIIDLYFKVKNGIQSKNACVDITNVDIADENGPITIDIADIPEVSVIGSLNSAIVISADRNQLSCGKTFNIAVSGKELSEFRGMELVLDYNKDVFEISSDVEILNACDDALTASWYNDKFILAYDALSTVDGSCDFLIIPMKVKDDAVYGNYEITVTGFKPSPVDVAAPTAISVSVSPEAADAFLNISADTQRAAANENITYSFELTDAYNVAGIEFIVDYDNTRLELIEAKEGLIGLGAINTDYTQDSIKVVNPFTLLGDPFTGTAKLFDLVFRVKDTAEVGNAAVGVNSVKSDAGITVHEAVNVEIYDENVIMNVEAVPSDEYVACGKEISFDVNLSANDAIAGLQLTYNYDPSSLEFVNADFGNFKENNNATLCSTDTGDEGEVGIIATLAEPLRVEDKFVTLTFRVKGDAQKGNINYSIDNVKIYDQSGNVDIKCNSARIIKRRTAFVLTPSKTVINHGEEVLIDFALVNLDETEGIQFEAVYDSEAFEFVEFVKSDFVESGSYQTGDMTVEGKIAGLFVFENAISDDEVKFGQLKLRAKTTYENRNTKVEITEVKHSAINGTDSMVRVPADKVDADVIINNSQDMANEVISLIDSIGDVTLDSGELIQTAENAYDALTDGQKELVTNYNVLVTAREKYTQLVNDKAAVDAVIAKIDAIGEVSLDSEGAIREAEKAYAELAENLKPSVTNYEKLTAAREVYDKLLADKNAVENVIALIADIGAVDLNSLEKINKANEAYNLLTEELKVLVTNSAELTAAAEEYNKQKSEVDAVIGLINAITEPVTKECLESITAAETAFGNLSDVQKSFVTNAESLIAKRTAYDAIKTVKFDVNGGSNKPDEQYVSVGENAKTPNEPTRSGYRFTGWYKESSCNNEWDFERDKIEEDITLYAGWKRKYSGGGGGGGGGSSSSSGLGGFGVVVGNNTNTQNNTEDNNVNDNSFSDTKGHWAEDSISALKKDGIVSGDSDGNYYPDRRITRAEFATMIYKLLKLDESKENQFDDVNESDWFNIPVSAVAKEGIIVGFEGKFRPNDRISRQEMAVIMSKVYDYYNIPEPQLKGLDSFVDSDAIAQWSAPHVNKLVSAGVINGYEDGSFKPDGDTTRAHAAAVIKAVVDKK